MGRFVLKINEVDGQAVARESAEVYCQWPGLALVTTESDPASRLPQARKQI